MSDSTTSAAGTNAPPLFLSLFPNWIGQTQPHVVKIDGDDLYLRSASPTESSGRTVNRTFTGNAPRRRN